MKQALLYVVILLFFLSSCKNDDRKNSSQTSALERNGVKIAYTSCGDADTTMLFIHGWCINKEYWDNQVKEFCPRYKVVAVDLPGFGQSGKNRTNWSFTEYGDDIKYLIDQLKLKNVVLFGHSMSGDIVLDVANRYPDAVIGLAGIDNLQDPSGPWNEEQQRGIDSFFTAMSVDYRGRVDQMKAGLFQPSTDSSIINRVMNDIYNTPPVISLGVMRAMINIAQNEKKLMTGLGQKLYLINSDVNVTNLDSLNKYCKNGCEVVPVHATGHYPMLEKPAEFNKQLQAVMNKIGTNHK